MENILIPAVIIIVILLIGLAIFFLLRGGGSAEMRAVTRSWGKVASSTRLKLTPPEKSLQEAALTGLFRQREMSVGLRVHAAIGRGGERSTIPYTHLQMHTQNPLRHFLRFSKKGAYRKTDRYLGAPLLPLKDAELDRRFDVKCIPDHIAVKALTSSPEFYKRLLAVRTDQVVELEVEASEIRFEQEGLIQDADYLFSLLELMDACANVVDRVQ